jgi:hypothetical protein
MGTLESQAAVAGRITLFCLRASLFLQLSTSGDQYERDAPTACIKRSGMPSMPINLLANYMEDQLLAMISILDIMRGRQEDGIIEAASRRGCHLDTVKGPHGQPASRTTLRKIVNFVVQAHALRMALMSPREAAQCLKEEVVKEMIWNIFW